MEPKVGEIWEWRGPKGRFKEGTSLRDVRIIAEDSGNVHTEVVALHGKGHFAIGDKIWRAAEDMYKQGWRKSGFGLNFCAECEKTFEEEGNHYLCQECRM